jgi:hypothetical protein
MRLGCQCEIGGFVGDVVVEAANPALFVANGSSFEGGDIAVWRHG